MTAAIILSSHQRAALETLRDGTTLNASDVGERIGETYYVANGILALLRSRGLVIARGSARGPRRYLWSITAVGLRALAEITA